MESTDLTDVQLTVIDNGEPEKVMVVEAEMIKHIERKVEWKEKLW